MTDRTTPDASATAGYVVDPDLVATIRDLLTASAPTPRDPEAGIAFDAALWDKLDALGLARLTTPEDDGGSGATWHESAALLTEMAAAAVSLPVAEHDLLAGWLLRAAGLPVDNRRRTIGLVEWDDEGRPVARAVPSARHADAVVLVSAGDGGRVVADVALSELEITEGLNLAGEPRDDVRLEPSALTGPVVADDVAHELFHRAGLVRAIQVAGALERCLSLTLEHTTTRVQFGRPISRFQAVQHLLADIAAETSLARAAVDAAVRAAAARDAGEADGASLAFLVAVARSCAGHAASVVVRQAHQLHGAIGTTLEHDLHRFTLAALAWRSEYGSTQTWDRRVAELATTAGTAGLWGLITR
ncbi:acyl-CoA dehydrogenase family protein [Nocardioides sp. DS6]|uniref:Acyl-CoA dehydrogenase family protein n=1 Tax=Nocardioides eburneus TaxID=3231482 RepID=A0ABV3T3F5_9ACTN